MPHQELEDMCFWVVWVGGSQQADQISMQQVGY